MTKLLGVGDVVAVLAQPGSGERYWLAVSSTNVWQGYNPDALDIPAVMLQPTSRPVKDSLVFIEDVSGLFSLRSVICDSVQLKQGPDRGHYLLPVIEEDRIITAMTAWENKNENDEDDGGDDDDNDGEDKDDDKKRKRRKKRSEKSWGLKKRRKQKEEEEEEGEEKGRLWDVSQIIGQRDGAEGREYLLEWEETLEPACRIVEGGRMCDLADDARLVGRQGGEFIDEHHYIHPEVLVIRKVKHLTRDRRRLAVRWRPTWTNELQCPATEVLQWRLQHQQGEEEAQEEETHEFEMQIGGIDTHPVAASSPTSPAAPIATATLAPQPTVTTTVASIVPLLQSYTTTDAAADAAAAAPAAAPAAAAPALSWRDIARTALANEGAMATLDEILASADPRKLAQTKNPKRRICEALKALGATSSRTRDRTTWALPPSSHQAQG